MFKLPSFFKSKKAIVLLGLILVGLIAAQYRQWLDRWSINKEITSLQQQEAQLRLKNQEIENSLQFLTSTNYKEQLAREQLGLQKEGEIAIRFPSAGDQINKPNFPNQTTSSNPQKWWSYFFLNNIYDENTSNQNSNQ